MRGVEWVCPSSERRAVTRFIELVVLPGVDVFVANRGTELLPTVSFVGRLFERNRTLVYCRVIFRDACLSLCSM
jgi:hypothetical protein